MSLRNRLYRLQYRSVKNLNNSNFIQQSQQKQYEKQVHSIETILHIMYSAFKNNLKMQEIYLDLIKARGRNVRIRGRDIKKVYQLLSENKTAEITFEKVYSTQQRQRKLREQAISNIWTQRQGNNTKTKDIMIATVNKIFQKSSTEQSQKSSISQKKLLLTKKQSNQQLNEQQKRQQNFYMKILTSHYKRLYSRLIEEITKKLTYYIINKNKLYELLINSIAQVTKKLQTILRRINDMKDTKAILDVIKLVFDENLLLEQKIYQALVDYGHVVSIQEFFRISGKMMEDSQNNLHNKNSRLSEKSKQLSVISSKSSQNHYQQYQQKNTKKFHQHNKGAKKYNNKNNQKICFIQKNQDEQKLQKPQKQQKNIAHIQRVHKQIQTKYAAVLDQISDLIVNNQQKLEKQDSRIILKEDETVFKDNQNSQQQNGEKTPQNSINPFDRWKRQNQKRKTTAKKTITAFQYFSPQFKKVINQLDEKKGKQHPLKLQNTTDKTLKFYQSTQFGKITNETISFKNPLNVARLLGKRFKTIANTQLISLNKSRNMRKMARQKTQFYNLLKMYQNNQKQNQHLEQLLQNKSSTINVHQLKFKQDSVKQKIMKQIKRKKSMFVKRNSLNNNKKSDEQLIKQIEDQYERLVREKKLRGVRFNDDDIRVDFDVSSEDEFDEIDMNCVNTNQNDAKKSRQKIKIQYQPYSPRMTPNPKLTIQPIKLSNLEKIYNQFTNPLNLKEGYYNDQIYRSLRSSLQKRQINTLKLKKCRYIKQDTFLIKKNVAFGQKKSQNSLQHKKSKKSSQAFKNSNLRQQRRSHPILIGNKSPITQNLNNTFLLTSCQISTPKIQNYPLNSKDLERYIQMNLKQNNLNTSNSIQKCEFLHFKQQASSNKIYKNEEIKKIQSLRNTPRNSWGRKNQVYSTQRRRKIE